MNAAILDAEPSDEKLQEFVRCAALRLESEGYFAMAELEGDSRWKYGSTYTFVMDMMGNQVLSGNWIRVNGNQLHEWGGKSMPTDQFGGRDIVGTGDTFGEAPIYYRAINPATGAYQGKVGLLKRIVAQGVPLLVGAGYYVSPDRPVAATNCSDNYVTASAIRTQRDIPAYVECAAEYVMENGTAEARRAFNEDERWRQGPYYIFVDGLSENWAESIVHVFPPDACADIPPGARRPPIPSPASVSDQVHQTSYPYEEAFKQDTGAIHKKALWNSQCRFHLSSVISSVGASLGRPVTPARKSPRRTGCISLNIRC